MPLKRLEFQPGVNIELTPTANSSGYAKADLGRWRYGRPEPIGGWTRVSPTPLVGICRSLHYWSDLSSIPRISTGTNERLSLENSGTVTDITPPTFVPGKISSGATPYTLLIWSLDNFGQNLIAVPSGQSLFQWTPTTVGPATPVTTAPAVMQGMFVMMPQQIVMAYGCTPVSGGQSDSLLARWSDQSDYTAWTASTTNQAGSFRLSRGNRIVGGLQAPNFAALWTDIDLWLVQYIGFPLVFSFTQAGSNCGLLAQKAACVLGGVMYWLSDHGPFRMAGSGPEQMQCPVWDFLYKDLDTANQDKCFAGTNYHYSEIYYFFPSLSGGTGEVDSYIKLNVQEGEWDYGTYVAPGQPSYMARTAWTDLNQPGYPTTVDLSGKLVQQEIGYTVDGLLTVPTSIRTGFTDLSGGEQILCIDQFIPDFKWGPASSALNLTIYLRNWPGDTTTTLGPFLVTPTTESITLRLPTQINVNGTNITTYGAPRCREIALQLDNVSGWWRLGTPRVRAFDAGRM